MRWSSVLVAAALVVTAVATRAAAAEKHVGMVTDVVGNRLTIEEMGPWRSPETVPVPRTFILTGSTTISRVQRTPEGSEGWAWNYVSRPATVSDIQPGDVVTVSVDPASRQSVALDVQALRPEREPFN